MNADRIFGRAAELAFYFLFALFPTLFSASSILGLAAKSGPAVYDKLLNYLALVIPSSALNTVLVTFNQTTAASRMVSPIAAIRARKNERVSCTRYTELSVS